MRKGFALLALLGVGCFDFDTLRQRERGDLRSPDRGQPTNCAGTILCDTFDTGLIDRVSTWTWSDLTDASVVVLDGSRPYRGVASARAHLSVSAGFPKPVGYAQRGPVRGS